MIAKQGTIHEELLMSFWKMIFSNFHFQNHGPGAIQFILPGKCNQ
jgi:hypothetical protein